MSLLPLKDLVIPKKQPQGTLSLIPAFQQQAGEMVETYIFTGAIRRHFEEILESVVRGRGQGFWVQAEYGAGKTHFLVVLSALLSGGDGRLWDLVSDDDVRAYHRRLGTQRLFPIVVSLRGEGSADPFLGRSLLDVLLEEGFQRALDHAGLADQVQVTGSDELLGWIEGKASQAIRREAEEFVRQRTGYTLAAYRDNEGVQALGRLLAEYCRAAGIRPEITASVKARLARIYEQLTQPGGPGYGGMLVVIDEYEGWQKKHNSEAELSADAELLETLGYLLPRDLGCRVYTVVASQSSVPAKLRGEQEGDRFVNVALLAQENERDYDVIVSRRVRALNEDRLPEIDEHYDEYTRHFAFARDLSREQFYDIFPFQPRCFEVVRRITARDLPTTRSGLSIFWEAVSQPHLLDRTRLIRVADLVTSSYLVEDCLRTGVYQEGYAAYQAAYDVLDTFDLEPADLALARDILATLFLWRLAFLDNPRRMSLEDLAQATLTIDDYMRAADNVAYVLSQMSLSQVKFDNETALFEPSGGGEPQPVTLLNEEKRKLLRDRYQLQSAVSSSLFWTPRDTGGAAGLFHEFTPDERATRRVQSRHLEYPGEVIVATGWRLDHGVPLPKEDVHFRLVILTPSAAQSVRAADLQDARIAVVVPGEMNDEAREAAATYLAWGALYERYRDKPGREAETVRSWLDGKRRAFIDNLIETHLKLYQVGQVITRDGLAISARDAFGRGGGNEARIGHIVEQLLLNAYTALPIDPDGLRGTLTPAEAGKLFAGYFDPNPSSAETAAARNYGVGLGLSHPDQPAHFAPQSPRVLELIEGMLSERGGAELPTWQIYDKLSAMPHGLPYVVVQLYLLAFVRRGAPRVDLLLKPRNTLRGRDRQPLGRDRLTAGNVVEIEWKPGLEAAFDSLVPAVGPTWNDTLRWAREVADDLRASTDQSDIEDQTGRLCGALEALKTEVETQRRSLGVLAGALGARLPAPAAQALDQLEALTTSVPAGHAEFHERAEEVFEARPEALRETMQTFTRLRTLASLAAEIAMVKRYLDDVLLRPGDRDLAADRMTLSMQLSLDELAARPEAWDRLRDDFNRFRTRYQTVYRIHHRDYYAALGRLRDELAAVPRQLNALGLLNRIEGLGTPLGDDLAGRYETLQGMMGACPVTRVADVSVERAPACDQCRLRLVDAPPEGTAQDFLRDLSDALDDKRRQLATEAVSRVLARGGRDDLATFLEAIRAADLAALVDVMSPDLADFVEGMLADEGTIIVDADPLLQLARRFPSLEEGEVEAAVAEFRRLLEEIFARERAAHPDKKTIRLTLH